MLAPGSSRRLDTDPLLILAAGAIAALTIACSGLLADNRISAFAFTSLAHGLIYLGAVWLVARGGDMGPRALGIILIAALLFRGLAMTAPPSLTTDALRYVWDGRIQWAGFSPYLQVPADPTLAHLRDGIIFPFLNQKETAVTIYPPMAQMLFAGAVKIVDGIEGMKLLAAAAEAITIWLLLRWLSVLELPRERVLIYAWHPVPIWELSSQAHLDAAAMALLMLGIVLAFKSRQGWAGAALAAAALVKYFPVVLLPALWKRWDWRMPAAFVATAALLYLPYWWSAGSRVIGFLAQHLDNEGYASGYGFHLVWLLRDAGIADPPGSLYVVFALTILGGLGLSTLFRRPADEIKIAHLLALAGAFVFLTSPHYPWYFCWLVPLLCARAHAGTMAMTLLAPLLYARVDAASTTRVYVLVFGSYLVVSAIGWMLQRRALAAPATSQAQS